MQIANICATRDRECLGVAAASRDRECLGAVSSSLPNRVFWGEGIRSEIRNQDLAPQNDVLLYIRAARVEI